MKCVRFELGQEALFSGSVVCIGNMDGVHVGHCALINRAKAIASAHDLPLVVVTFEPYPKEFFLPHPPARLTRLSEKLTLLAKQGVDATVSLRFTSTLAALTPESFIQRVLVRGLSAHTVVVGDDFRFGSGRAGDVTTLRALGSEYDFSVEAMDSVKVNDERVSSTFIRTALAAGNLEQAQQMLGRAYRLTSRVIYGDQRGREWGFPTANLPLFRMVSPLTGIFAVRVYGEDFQANGVASVGYRPVFRLTQPLLEVFLLDFDRDIYGQRLSVDFLHKLREEADFNSVEQLIAQIRADVEQARRYFS